MTTTKPATPDWFDLLHEAVLEPGRLAQASRYFRQYSLANRCLAASQLAHQGVPLQPINTFKGWLAVNRSVQKGQKALALIMPVPVRATKKESETTTGDGDKAEILFHRFILRNLWFHLGQTEGEEYTPELSETPDWSLSDALEFLDIKEREFIHSGFDDFRESSVEGRSIAVSKLAQHPQLARIRAAAKVLLGHTALTPAKSVPNDPVLRDIEAEAVAFLVGATLELDGLEDSRARMQTYLDKGTKVRVPEKCAHRAFGVADKLINAG